MKFKEKYKALQNDKPVKDKIVSSVYATMMLKGQGVSVGKLQKLYDEVTANAKSEAVA
ncbi:MAG: hypothetical protein AAF519_19905 [Bacteroidota bacterium]